MKRFFLLILAVVMLMATLLPAAQALETVPNVKSTDIRFDRKGLVVYVGECYDMPSFLETKSGKSVKRTGITWKSSNNSIVSMDKKTGVALGMKPGSATITATTKDKKKATIKLTVKRNKLDNIYGKKPGLSLAAENDYELVLKSVNITEPDIVVCEYYLINNTDYVARSFSKFTAKITAYDTYYEKRVTIVNGSPVLPIRVNCPSRRVKVFKAIFKFDDVQHTDIALPKSGKKSIRDTWDVLLDY